MLCTFDNLQTYLQCAFDHFSRAVDMPSKFFEMVSKNKPIPRDFRGEILELMKGTITRVMLGGTIQAAIKGICSHNGARRRLRGRTRRKGH